MSSDIKNRHLFIGIGMARFASSKKFLIHLWWSREATKNTVDRFSLSSPGTEDATRQNGEIAFHTAGFAHSVLVLVLYRFKT